MVVTYQGNLELGCNLCSDWRKCHGHPAHPFKIVGTRHLNAPQRCIDDALSLNLWQHVRPAEEVPQTHVVGESANATLVSRVWRYPPFVRSNTLDGVAPEKLPTDNVSTVQANPQQRIYPSVDCSV